jgi:hypothetical protein
MPQGPSTLHGRVSKTSANLKSLNVSNIVALKREINTPSRGQLQQSNNTLPDSAASNAPHGLRKDTIIKWIGEVGEVCGLLTDRDPKTVIWQTWSSRCHKRLLENFDSPQLPKKKRALIHVISRPYSISSAFQRF